VSAQKHLSLMPSLGVTESASPSSYPKLSSLSLAVEERPAPAWSSPAKDPSSTGPLCGAAGGGSSRLSWPGPGSKNKALDHRSLESESTEEERQGHNPCPMLAVDMPWGATRSED